jgi:hypothetical protein
LALSVRPSVRPSKFCFWASSLQLLAGTQWIFMGIINIKKRCDNIALLQSDLLTQSYGPWLVMHYTYRAKIVSSLILCNYWLKFKETLLEPSIPREYAHIISLFRSDTLTQSYGPWLVKQYTYCATIVSTLLLCNYWLKFNETLWEPSIPTGDANIVALFRSDTITQSYGPWLIMQYAYRAIMVSVLFLCNYWLEFNETLWEPSIPRVDAHIIALFRSDTLTLSYGPWLVMQYAYRANIMEPSKPRGDADIIALFRSDTNSELWPLISYAGCI